MISTTLVRYVLTAALRDKLIAAYSVMLILGVSLSLFISSSAVIEQDQFALVFSAGGLRILLILTLSLFVVFHMRRSFDAKDVDFLLSRPLGRIPFILSHSAAFSLLALLLGGLTSLLLWAIMPHHFGAGHILWALSITAEAIIIVNAALFFSMVITSAVAAVMAVTALYVLGRMMGQILGIIEAGTSNAFRVLEIIMQAISTLIPRLDLMGQTAWLLYDVETAQTELVFVFAQTAVFVFLIITASLIDLLKRQF